MHLCERCHQPATVHSTEISGGKPHDVHLCEKCAQEAGYIQSSHIPINELLNQFLKTHAQMPDVQANRCPDCGLSWQEFKDTGLLGCGRDYALFEPQLQGVIERAQQGGTHHTGKALRQPAALKQEDPVKLRQAEINRLKKELSRAVEEESYEKAAQLRDQIKTMENSSQA